MAEILVTLNITYQEQENCVSAEYVIHFRPFSTAQRPIIKYSRAKTETNKSVHKRRDKRQTNAFCVISKIINNPKTQSL
jgi:hypothetical protein